MYLCHLKILDARLKDNEFFRVAARLLILSWSSSQSNKITELWPLWISDEALYKKGKWFIKKKHYKYIYWAYNWLGIQRFKAPYALDFPRSEKIWNFTYKNIQYKTKNKIKYEEISYEVIIQVYSGIFRILCNLNIFRTVAYSEPWYIQNICTLKIWGIVRTLSNIYDKMSCKNS